MAAIGTYTSDAIFWNLNKALSSFIQLTVLTRSLALPALIVFVCLQLFF